MILRSGKRLTICSKEQNKTRKKQRVRPYLPEELIINDILIRLPARTLAICSCVSKLWYNSIFHDPKFTSSHFVENKNKLKLVFNLLNVFENGLEKAYFLSIEEKISKNTDFYYHKVLADISFGDTSDVVGYCNGLVCLNLVTEIAVINPTRGERLVFSNSFPGTMGCMYLCHGFGFDSSLQEYKVVFVYTTTMNEEKEEKLVCMVITLGGENSWREIVTSTAKISSPPGFSPLPSRMVTRPSRSTRRSAALCGGDMFWRITYTSDNNDKSDMLLSFNIHNEKFRFIRLPPECCLTHTTTTTTIDEHQCLVVDHHLLEFQGGICVARTEMRSNSSDCHLQHRNHHCKGQEKICCCGFKVHLYIMNDKVKQLWTKGKTFSFPVKDGLLPDPFCNYFSVTPPYTYVELF
ncbi:putative F-box protein At3g52320 [Papaver somniferum]|uniref:putative F-box protein At3g52320 n=1 Tax=Papaver somniferum TaxID=3469 RepID=UPI000E6FB7F1|nr:putative F-box protein At3g52320 [Papaver somniferum]